MLLYLHLINPRYSPRPFFFAPNPPFLPSALLGYGGDEEGHDNACTAIAAE